MKLAANLTLMFTEVPLVERFQAAADAGFKGVELLMPEGVPPDELARAARQAGVEVVLFNNGVGDLVAGGPGISGVPGRERTFRECIEESKALAVALQAPCMHAGPSLIPEEFSRHECLSVYQENLEHAARVMSEVGTKVLLEPMNRTDMPTALITEPEQALDIIDAVDPVNLGLQFDFYHIYMNGHDIEASLSKVIHRVEHIQFSDAPGRGEPGSAEIDFEPGLAVIRQSAYGGWVSAEYLPTRTTRQTLSWMQTFRL